MSGWLPVIAGTGSAVAAGFYLAFSAVVMPALRRQPAQDAIATMVSINEKAVRPPFMILFFGTAAACGAVAVAAATDPLAHPPTRVAGAVAYLAGWASTMVVNVPMNTSLAGRGDGNGNGRADLRWRSFDQPWSRANHVRCALSIAAAVGLLAPVHNTGS